MRHLLIVLFIAPSCLSCVRSNTLPESSTLAYVPVYASLQAVDSIAIQDPQPTIKSGKIYVYDQYIFQNEQNKGIHIIDNSDRDHPIKKAFLSIAFNTEMAVKNNRIYANRINDLIVINISDPLHPQVVSTTKDAFPMISQTHPPFSGYFVCPDPSKGTVVDWTLEPVEKALCRR